MKAALVITGIILVLAVWGKYGKTVVQEENVCQNRDRAVLKMRTACSVTTSMAGMNARHPRFDDWCRCIEKNYRPEVIMGKDCGDTDDSLHGGIQFLVALSLNDKVQVKCGTPKKPL